MILFCHTKTYTVQLQKLKTMLCYMTLIDAQVPSPDADVHQTLIEMNEIVFFLNIRDASPAAQGSAVEHAPHTAADLTSQTSFHRLGSRAPGHRHCAIQKQLGLLGTWVH